MRNVLENYLIREPRARERKNKNRCLANILLEKYDLKDQVPKEVMTNIISDVLSMDRLWRKILEERVDLRGSDYGQKDELEKAKQAELGYNV